MFNRTAMIVLLLASSPLFAQQPPTPPTPAPTVDEKVLALFKAQKFDEAYKELQAAAKANPKSAPPRVTLSNLFFQAREGAAARSQLELAAAEDPKHPEVYLLNASYAFGEGRLTDTIMSCQVALQLSTDPKWDPDQRKRYTREARIGLAAAFEARRDWNSAKENLSAVLVDDPKNGSTRQRLGTVIFFLGRPEDAFSEFQTASKDDPASDLPELRMSALYGGQNDSAKAEDWLKKAVATYPNDAKTHRAYASFLLDAGNSDAALLYVESSTKLDQNNPETIALRGLLARYRKDLATAETIFDALNRDRPGATFAAWNLALVLAETNNKEKHRRAIEIAEAEVRKNQKSAEGFAILGWCYYKAGRLDDAEKAIVAATQAGAVSRDAAYFLARILTDKQRFEDAHKVLKGAADARGGYVYKAEAAALLKEIEPKLPKKEEKK